jgi:hypothetical protein
LSSRGNHLVRETSSQQCENLPLPLAQQLEALAVPALLRVFSCRTELFGLERIVIEQLNKLRRQILPPCEHEPDRLKHHFGHGRFRDEPGGADTHHRSRIRHGIGARKNDQGTVG